MTNTKELTEREWAKLDLGLERVDYNDPKWSEASARNDEVTAKRLAILDKLAFARVLAERGEELPDWCGNLERREYCVALQERLRVLLDTATGLLPIVPRYSGDRAPVLTSGHAGDVRHVAGLVHNLARALEVERSRLQPTPLDVPDAISDPEPEDDLPAIEVPASASNGAAS